MEHTPQIQAQQESLGAARERFNEDSQVLAEAFDSLADTLVEQGMHERTAIIVANHQDRSQACEQAQDTEQEKIAAAADRCNGRLADAGFFDDLLDEVPPNKELADFWVAYWNGIEVRQAIQKGRREAQQVRSTKAVEMKESMVRQAIQAQSKESKDLVQAAANTASLEHLDKIITSQTLALVRICDDSTRSLLRTCTDELADLKALVERGDEGLTSDLTRLETTLEELLAKLQPVEPVIETTSPTDESSNVHSLASARARRTLRRLI